MHITFVFHCPGTADARELGFNLAQYNLSLIEAMLAQDSSLRVQIITSKAGRPLHLRPSLDAAVRSGTLTIRPLFRRNTLSMLSLAWRVCWRKTDMAHFQHETYHYGGALSIPAFPLLLGWIRLWTQSVATLHHIVDTQNFTPLFSRLFATRLPPAVIHWGFWIFYRLTGWMASALIVHESCDKVILSHQYGLNADKIAVIPHGSEDRAQAQTFDRAAARRQWNIPQDAEHVFGFFSYFDLTKGIDVLIPAFLKHLRSHPRDVLLIAGTRNPYHLHSRKVGEILDTLHALSDLKSKGRIIWAGCLSPEQAIAFYRTVDCTIAPYRIFNGGSAAIAKSIGYRVPILLSEAFAPCVQNPDLTFPLSPHGLADTLHRYTDHQDDRTAIMQQIDAWRNDRLWPSVGRHTLTFYRTRMRVQPATILLLGAYGQKNLGDDLLLHECLLNLPKENCVVTSADPEYTTQSHAVRAVPSRLGCGLLRAFLHARTLVIGGGDQFKLLKPSMGRSRHSLLLREWILVLCAKILRKSVFFVGVGIGDISTHAARLLTRQILLLADATVMRDRESEDIAHTLAPKAEVGWGTDLAFLQPPSLSSKTPPSPVVIRTLGVAPACHWDNPRISSHVMQELAVFLDEYLAIDTSGTVLFLPFQTDTLHNDLKIIDDIRGRMHKQDQCRSEMQLTLETVDHTYQTITTLIGMRLHSLILATIHCVPFIALVYDVKVKKFLEEIDCARWGIALDGSFSAQRLLTLHRELETEYDSVQQHLRSQAGILQQRAETNADLLRKIGAESAYAYPEIPPQAGNAASCSFVAP